LTEQERAASLLCLRPAGNMIRHLILSRVQELQTVLEKFVFFIGKNVKALFEREDESYCFRLHKNRVFYVSERLMKRATNVRDT
jgi:hypothetical protein